MTTFRLFVLRHGETDWSRERRFAGWRDVSLSTGGRRQCEAAAEALARALPAAVYASPLERARTSAEVIAKPHRLEVGIEPAFKEIGLGRWEGLTRDEVAVRFPAEHETWRTAPERFTAPGGEALAAMAERVRLGLEGLRARHAGETAILVTHAIVTRLIVLQALGLGPERLWTVDAAPTGISELEYKDDWVTVHRMNNLGHVSDVSVSIIGGGASPPPIPPRAAGRENAAAVDGRSDGA